MAKHTPGPWGAIGADVKTAGPTSRVICWTGQPEIALVEARANACLIAAAPDLLDMCERLLNFARYYGDSWAVSAADGLLTNAATLIAQAKGEG